MPRALFGIIALLSLTLAGCGTSVTPILCEISFEQTDDIGALPHQVGIYKHASIYMDDFSDPWFDQIMGETAPGNPYSKRLSAMDTRFFFDPSPPSTQSYAIAIPALKHDGPFVLNMEFRNKKEMKGYAKYVAFGDFFPAEDAPAVPVTYTCERQEEGWTCQLTITPVITTSAD